MPTELWIPSQAYTHNRTRFCERSATNTTRVKPFGYGVPINQLSLIYLVKEHWFAKNQKTIPRRYSLLTSRYCNFTSIDTRNDGGAMRDRTADLLRARQALSQLSYSPGNLLLGTHNACQASQFVLIEARHCVVCE